jgi:hypothetical protein
MGSSPSVNIEIETDFETSVEIAESLAEWTSHKVQDSDVSEDFIEYKFSWDASVDTGPDEHLQKLWIRWSNGQNEYDGVGPGRKLVIHYSSYYYEDSIERFSQKIQAMEDILEWLRENTNADLNHYVGVSTT